MRPFLLKKNNTIEVKAETIEENSEGDQDYMENLTNTQQVMAAWLEVIPDHEYTHKIRETINDLCMESVLATTAMQDADTEAQKPSKKHIQDIYAKYHKLTKSVKPMLPSRYLHPFQPRPDASLKAQDISDEPGVETPKKKSKRQRKM